MGAEGSWHQGICHCGLVGNKGPISYNSDYISVIFSYLEGLRGDFVSRLLTPITHIVTPVSPIVNLFNKSLDPKP